MVQKQHRDKDETMTERFVIPVPADLAEAIRDYWHEQKLDSKSEAVRMLIRMGLAAAGKKLPR
jgi:hypothetical protein